MSRQETLELLRKKMANCKQVYLSIAGDLLLSDVAATYVLRGGPTGKPKAGAKPKRSAPPKKISGLTNDQLSTLNKQLLWLRAAQLSVDKLFTGKPAETLRNELVALSKSISGLVNEAVKGAKFPKIDAPPPTDTLEKGVALVSKLVKPYLGKLSTSQVITYDNGVPYYTTMLIAHDVKIGKTKVPTYIVAVSESTGPKISGKTGARRHYLTQLPEVAVDFKPKLQWESMQDLERAVATMMSLHFVDAVTSDDTSRIQRKDMHIDGINRTTILPNGSLKVQLLKTADQTAVINTVNRFLIKAIKTSNPMYTGAITHVASVENGRRYVVFSAPQGMNRPSLRTNPVVRKRMKVDSASFDMQNIEALFKDTPNV